MGEDEPGIDDVRATGGPGRRYVSRVECDVGEAALLSVGAGQIELFLVEVEPMNLAVRPNARRELEGNVTSAATESMTVRPASGPRRSRSCPVVGARMPASTLSRDRPSWPPRMM